MDIEQDYKDNQVACIASKEGFKKWLQDNPEGDYKKYLEELNELYLHYESENKDLLLWKHSK